MTTTTTDRPLEVLKHKQQATWSSGDYGKIALLTVPVAESLVADAQLRPGSRVLDVATGTGHAALAAARQFCDVTGVDYVPALLETAQRRASAEGLAIDFREADAENLPFADHVFDVVLSAIGVMFTADHQRAAAELARVCRPQGRIGLANWTPDGFVGELLRTVGRHVPPPPAARPATRWGDPGTVRELFGEDVADLQFHNRSVTQRFASPEHFADHFLTHYGPTRKAAEALDGQARAALRDDMVSMARAVGRTDDGGFTAEWDYLIVLATRR